MQIKIDDTKKANIFCEIIKKFRLFTSSIVFLIDKEKFYIQSMDSAHVVVLELQLPSSWFTCFEVDEESSLQLGIDTMIISKILSVKADKQFIRLYTEKEDKLGIDFCGGDEDFNRFFEIPLMDIDSELLGIPESDYDVTFVMDSKKFKAIVDDFACFDNDIITFSCDESFTRMMTSGMDGDIQVEVPPDKIPLYEITEGCTVTSSYNLSFLQKMVQFTKTTSYIQLQVSANFPLEVKYNLCELNKECFLRFYIAPSIDD